jgi:hypothetical protein
VLVRIDEVVVDEHEIAPPLAFPTVLDSVTSSKKEFVTSMQDDPEILVFLLAYELHCARAREKRRARSARLI